MRVLILGGGGREHAIAWHINQSSLCSQLFIAPGNAGTAQLGVNIHVSVMDFPAIREIVISEKIEFVIVGPDDPLGEGIVDFFKSDPVLSGISILGPSKTGAALEASKSFAKQFMKRHNIPTAFYRAFSQNEKEEAYTYLKNHSLPVVIKADGLAAGKGVMVCTNQAEALEFLREIFEKNKFGRSGAKVVIEDFLKGIELSVFVLTDGHNYILLPEAKDYKRVGEADTGPNTGGMGAISPVPFFTGEFRRKVIERIIEPTIDGIKKEGIDYKGFIFFGLIKVGNDPYVIEYNARMGDPETQVVFPRVQDDLLPLMKAAADLNLKSDPISICKEYAASVILVSEGYPGNYEKGKEISGLENVAGSLIFQAGTEIKNNHLVTSGGRVLAITSLSSKLGDAITSSYNNADKIEFEGKYFRKDIGADLKKLLTN